MKIAWFTPFNKLSSIGQISKLVCEEIQKFCVIDIYTFSEREVITSTVPITYFEPSNFDTRCLDKYDHVVYNMGNFAGYHKEIWEVMQQYPGILILHDQIMQNFFQQITMNPDYGGKEINGEQDYINLMRHCYGEQGEEAAKAFYKSYLGNEKQRVWNSTVAMNYPLLQPILSNATAVFSHARFFIENIKKSFYGPIDYAYLPYDNISHQSEVKLPTDLLRKGKKLVVSTGLVHPIKRIDKIAEMLIDNPDIARRVQYVVIGDCGGHYGDYLNSLSKGPLNGCLYLIGYQSYEVMNEYLQRADFCVNLRFPNSEVCSKALIDQMSFENPVIVVNQGIFNEIPDECVVKINIKDEIDGLVSAFRFLLGDKNKRNEIGQHALNFVKLNCTPEVYANKFLSFLNRIHQITSSDKIVNDIVNLNKRALIDLSFNQENTSGLVGTICEELNKLTGAISCRSSTNAVIGIWFGFPYVVELRREGITRFILYMLLALLEYYPIQCEIWTYSFNYEEIINSFAPILNSSKYNGRVQIITEQNYKEKLKIKSFENEILYRINAEKDNLSYLAKLYSMANCFITAIVYLDNVIGTRKPIFVPVHDLGIHVHYDDFILIDPLYKARHVDIRSRAENLARSGAHMFCESDYVRDTQVLQYIKSINPSYTHVIYFPTFLPSNMNKYYIDEKLIRDKLGLMNPFLFYPTQIRPYKNVSVLVEALYRLRSKNINVDLVLTGKPTDVPIVEDAINQYNLQKNVICLSDLTEEELFSLYHYAALTAMPTLFEGGFPLQAMEALTIGSPIVLSDIPVVRERIKFCGMTTENCGLELFDPHSPSDCAEAIERVLLDREKALKSQKHFREVFLSYTWKDAATKYYHLFFKSPENGKVL